MTPPVAPEAARAVPRGCTNLKLRQLTRLVGRHYDAVVGQATGLKGTQYSLLTAIDKRGPVKPAEVAALLSLDPSTLSRNLARLVEAGWVLQGPGADQRSRLLTLTPAGQALREQGRQAWKAAQLALNARLGEARVAALHQLLDEALDLMAEDAGPRPLAGGEAADDPG
ncbi:MarR family winged helix-turn-helix transcriptional regulator [Ideonella livida]|uniref:MarR family winged helix-turn-helix transcriptional regulator n=1 Tax=Ideonella livida TaxID=2707176 RepID=UPI00287333A0|nr:MarR family winged helix-turn-helix transcriptional regulator [Ideonella livida]